MSTNILSARSPFGLRSCFQSSTVAGASRSMSMVRRVSSLKSQSSPTSTAGCPDIVIASVSAGGPATRISWPALRSAQASGTIG